MLLVNMIKIFYKQIINIFNTLLLKLSSKLTFADSFFYFLTIRASEGNTIRFAHVNTSKSLISIDGYNNTIQADNALIENCMITIKGENNQIIIKNGAKLRNVIVNMRGENCKIIIGEQTSFGQARLVNVGRDNDIMIGSRCLFADNIEVWASDTHSIYNQNGLLLNPEKPITIGNDVWIGSYVKILKGVTIGDNAIIGMNTLVTKDVAHGTLCAGNPLRILKSNVTWSLKYKGIE